ncbi:UNVERIFIED_ORG: hypothetical protein M2438_000095 [Methylobacterium sp. SuP10 SLI 274]|uniref:hypothetical protein n=1 Tax=Methylorubrum extorquens TaxID=408 RepID=UPI00209CAF8D|nr:hypothetical protein [Methylorubrum extorquens]MDF9861291.1 hypothetical protein [Methylorubrum pseudosasae]MDH6634920.1 hypothetical protein [Methylobacterium sp. SuP10 SLI 274]MDH6664090.1 hypothetical protein [Methylorubrum zatmanii]MCP1561096.1 hypothetical protein [Methylorubrum extorquens]MDF9789574.1 hypothetical protein [Methylorubrum extorquens]
MNSPALEKVFKLESLTALCIDSLKDLSTNEFSTNLAMTAYFETNFPIVARMCAETADIEIKNQILRTFDRYSAVLMATWRDQIRQ